MIATFRLFYNTIAACQRPVGPLLSNKCIYVNSYVTMTSSEVCSVSKQLAGGLQAHHSADNCLTSCLYNDGVVSRACIHLFIY